MWVVNGLAETDQAQEKKRKSQLNPNGEHGVSGSPGWKSVPRNLSKLTATFVLLSESDGNLGRRMAILSGYKWMVETTAARTGPEVVVISACGDRAQGR